VIPSFRIRAGAMSADEVLTVAEVASELRCSKAHVLNCIHGRVHGVTALPSLSLGRRKLVRRSALEQWKYDNERIAGNAMITASPKSVL